jgi:magnesium transporter
MLINCVVYQAGHRLADIDVADIHDWLSRPGCLVWVALLDPEPIELERMQQAFGLHELAVEDARKGHQRPKLEEYGDSLFLVMQLLESEPAPSAAIQVGEVAVFVGANFVLSVRSRSSQGFLGVRARSEREPHLLKHGPGYVLYALLDAVVDRYFPVLDALETSLEEVEAQIFERGSARERIQELYQLKERAAVLRHAVAPLLEVAGKLHGGRAPSVCMPVQEYFRDVHDHLVRINASVDAIRDTIGTALQVNLALIAIEQTDTTKRLAAWAAIFAAPTAMAGIWGMNFDAMPELHWQWGYPAALLAIAGVTFTLYWRFRRAGWLSGGEDTRRSQ